MRRLIVAVPAAILMAAAASAGAQEGHAGVPPIEPTLSADFDYRQYPAETEGFSGFVLARFRPGVTLSPRPWFRAAGTFEFVAEHGAVVKDAYMRLRASDGLAFTAGYSKTPLFPSFAHEPEGAGAFPDRAPVVTSFSIPRDLGVDARFTPRALPLEAAVRVGNGTGSATGNDNSALPAGYASLDWVTGRAHPHASGTERNGLRLGAAGLIEKNADREGITGTTPFGFTYFGDEIVSGLRRVGEGHLIAYAGPARLTIEGALADESRSRDDDGNPSTPRLKLESMRSYGLTAELAWMLRGKPRAPGKPPRGSAAGAPWDGGAIEASARYDGLWLGRGASDIEAGGSQGGSVAVKWWPQDFLSATLSGYMLRYERAPIEDPSRLGSWGVALRGSFSWGQ